MHHRFARCHRKHKMRLVRVRGAQDLSQLVDPCLVSLRAPRGIDQDRVALLERLARTLDLVRRQRDVQGHADDVRVRPQLIDRGDPVRIARDEPDGLGVPELVRRGELGDRRCFPDARRPGERDRQRPTVFGFLDRCLVRVHLDVLRNTAQNGGLHDARVLEFCGRELIADKPDDFVREFRRHLVLDQTQVAAVERIGHHALIRARRVLEHTPHHPLDRCEFFLETAG